MYVSNVEHFRAPQWATACFGFFVAADTYIEVWEVETCVDLHQMKWIALKKAMKSNQVLFGSDADADADDVDANASV